MKWVSRMLRKVILLVEEVEVKGKTEDEFGNWVAFCRGLLAVEIKRILVKRGRQKH